MDVERGVDMFANQINNARDEAVDYSQGPEPVKNWPAYDVERLLDSLLFALDDLQRQIDELKEEAR